MILIEKNQNMRLIDKWRYALGFLGSAINFRFGKPQWGDILITEKCPVACKFCIYSCNMKGRDMSEEDISAIIRAFAKYKVSYIRILGGEPFVVYDKMIYCLKELMKYYKPNQITVVTSGYFATTKRKVIEKLKPLKDLGLIHLTLSYDTTHFELIKEKYYENAIKAATELGLNVEFNVTYNNKLHRLLPRIQYFIKKYGITIAVHKIYPFGLAAKLPKEDISFDGEDYHKFLKAVLPHQELKKESSLDKLMIIVYRALFSNIKLCSQYTAFPNGNVYFCCVNQNSRLIGNFHKDELTTLFKGVQESWLSNVKRAISFLSTTHREVSCPCEVCVLHTKY